MLTKIIELVSTTFLFATRERLPDQVDIDPRETREEEWESRVSFLNIFKSNNNVSHNLVKV